MNNVRSNLTNIKTCWIWNMPCVVTNVRLKSKNLFVIFWKLTKSVLLRKTLLYIPEILGNQVAWSGCVIIPSKYTKYRDTELFACAL